MRWKAMGRMCCICKKGIPAKGYFWECPECSKSTIHAHLWGREPMTRIPTHAGRLDPLNAQKEECIIGLWYIYNLVQYNQASSMVHCYATTQSCPFMLGSHEDLISTTDTKST